jgi:hypothetical protein
VAKECPGWPVGPSYSSTKTGSCRKDHHTHVLVSLTLPSWSWDALQLAIPVSNVPVTVTRTVSATLSGGFADGVLTSLAITQTFSMNVGKLGKVCGAFSGPHHLRGSNDYRY